MIVPAGQREPVLAVVFMVRHDDLITEDIHNPVPMIPSRGLLGESQEMTPQDLAQPEQTIRRDLSHSSRASNNHDRDDGMISHRRHGRTRRRRRCRRYHQKIKFTLGKDSIAR